MELVEKNLRPRDILTRKAFENAATVVAGRNWQLRQMPLFICQHWQQAQAEVSGIDFDLHDVAEIFKRTPYIADLKPGGKFVARDMYEIGGVPVG